MYLYIFFSLSNNIHVLNYDRPTDISEHCWIPYQLSWFTKSWIIIQLYVYIYIIHNVLDACVHLCRDSETNEILPKLYVIILAYTTFHFKRIYIKKKKLFLGNWLHMLTAVLDSFYTYYARVCKTQMCYLAINNLTNFLFREAYESFWKIKLIV